MSIHETIGDAAVDVRHGSNDALTASFGIAQHAAPANVNVTHPLDNLAYAWAKRVLDLAIAIPALVILSPLLAVVAALIRMDSPGPALFRQVRLGLNGKPFNIFKFRTMTVQENGDDVRQACRNDARVTRPGRFLRTSSIDELPQLLNVIRGEMSIIGPRPHARAHDEMFAKLIDCYTQRQGVKPGITGWAQVHGLRGETPTVDAMRARVDYDIWYVHNANFALDIEILFRTVAEIFRSGNAY
ncbi:MAG TPA: exopolysaccharide biosynthesis polyprenyl glycosylphosphotransferase [Rhizomicrobium sp.]